MSVEHGVPVLGTLGTRASWLNEAGRIDRSACVEVRVAQVWRMVEEWEAEGAEVPSAGGKAPSGGEEEADVEAVPLTVWEREELAYRGVLENPLRAALARREDEVAMGRSGRGVSARLASGVALVTEWMLGLWMGGHGPRKVAGDWRTARAPAMRPGRWRAGDGHRAMMRAKCKAATGGGAAQGARSDGAGWSRSREEEAAALAARDALEARLAALTVPRGRKGFNTRTMNDRPIPEPDWGLAGNPNRGGTREKSVNAGTGWWQAVRVER